MNAWSNSTSSSGEPRRDDFGAGVAARGLLKAIERRGERREIDGRESDIANARREIPAERREERLGTVVGAGQRADEPEQLSDVVRQAIDGGGPHDVLRRRRSSAAIAAVLGTAGAPATAGVDPGTSVFGNAP